MTSVRSFFVLSAFLITEILLRQHARPEGIQLGRFYFRRSMRVFPPYIALLAGVALADHLGWFKLRPHDFLHAATYTMNLFDVPVPAPELRHVWTLAIEEQFYLGWPILLAALGPKRAAYLTAAFVLGMPCLRVAAVGHALPHWIDVFLHQRGYDAVATGCLLALLAPRLPARLGVLTKIAILVPIVAISSHDFHLAHARLFEAALPAMNISIALGIWSLLSPSIAASALSFAPLVYLGTLSYSVYLWQQLFCSHTRTEWVYRFPADVALMAVCALVSYWCIERPCMVYRERALSWLLRWWNRNTTSSAAEPDQP